MSNSVSIDSKTFFRRIGSIAEKLSTPEFQNADVLLVALGNSTDFTVYQKSTAIFSWLLGYEFPETVMVISRSKVAFLASHKKIQILDTLKADSEGIEVVTFGRDKEINRSTKQFESFFQIMQESAADDQKTLKIGILQKDKNEGPMVDEWNSFFSKQSLSYELIDAASSIAQLLAIKDTEELKLIDIASKSSSVFMKEHVLSKFLSVIDEDKKISHSKLSDDFENGITSQLKKYRTKLPPALNSELVDICYPPIVQSGGTYSLKPSALSSDSQLDFGVILCSLGIRYKSYCANIGRTFLIDPTKSQELNFEFLLDLQKYLLEEMKPGITLSSIYEKALQYTDKHRPELKSHLPNNLGFSMGLEFRESDYVINSKNARSLKTGMTFNFILGLQDLDNPEASNSKGKIYSLLLADTIEILQDGAKLLTHELKSLSQISYSFKSEQEQREARKSRAAKIASESVGTRPKLRAQQKIDEASERKRREHQKELARIRLQESKEIYAEINGSATNKVISEVQKFESYKKDGLWPKNIKSNRIFVDKRNDTVIFPVNGVPVAFHIATIKNVTKSEEGKSIYLRVNFVTPGRNFGRKESVTFTDPAGHFLRSLTAKTNDFLHAQEVLKEITDLRKQYSTREATKKEMADIVEQDGLIEVTGRRPLRLSEVHVRPSLEGRRLPGDVEIHSNGIRYKMQLKSDQKIDVLFSNIKHLFFQPCDNEMTVILHLHLKTPIMVGKKKTNDVQIYREALESHVEETGGRRRKVNYGDEDEIAQEREERRRRQQANEEFKSFAEKISEAYRGLEVEIPFRDLGFNGVSSRQTVLLQPTTECLVYLSEPPYTIVTLEDVEIAYLERVMFGLKNFDLVFIFRDHTKAPVHITSIPMSNLEAVKDWLDSVDVLFAESTVNYNWTNILKTVNDDPIGFYEMGGWSYLQPDAENDDDSEEEHSSEYEPEEEDDEEGYEDEDDEEDDSEEEEDSEEDEYSNSEEEEDDEDESEDSEEEDSDAPDWDELEEQARRADSRRERDSNKRRPVPVPTKPSKRR